MSSANWKLYLGLGALSFLSGCQNSQSNSLLSNSSHFASSYSINQEPSVADLRLVPDNPNLKYKSNAVEVSGSCHKSTFPNHDLILTYNNTLQTTLNVVSADATARCVNGRFDFVVFVPNAITSKTNLSLKMRVYNSSGQLASTIERALYLLP